MFKEKPHFKKAISLIDEHNQHDPNLIQWQNNKATKELIYGQQMTTCLEQFNPDASEALYLAARAQHIGRWQIPRSDYPMNAPGYHRWRKELMKLHAKLTEEILTKCEYDQNTIEKVTALIQKKGLKTNPETQCLENVICLVFLEHHFKDFAKKHPDEKVIDILQKTWGKMSKQGHKAALKIDFDPKSAALVKKALS